MHDDHDEKLRRSIDAAVRATNLLGESLYKLTPEYRTQQAIDRLKAVTIDFDIDAIMSRVMYRHEVRNAKKLEDLLKYLADNGVIALSNEWRILE